MIGPRRRPGWHSAPLGLLGMLVLVVAIERLEMRDNLDFMNNVAVSWKYTGKVGPKKARGKAVLCFGDSLVKFGVLPGVLAEQSGERSYSLALQSGSAPSSYFMLRRALREGARPSAAVVDFARGILGDGPASTTRPYPWADLLDIRETLELCRTARDPDLFASILVQKLLHSDKGRYEIRNNLLTALKGERTGQGDIAPALWRNWNSNDGGQANPKVPPFADDGLPPWVLPKPGTWRCHPANEAYVRRFLELAQAHRITVYWLLPPVTPGTQSIWEKEGNECLFLDFVREMQARYPGLVVIDGRYSGYRREVFVDGVHLDRDGASALSAGVGQVLRDFKARASDGTRWVKLPDFREKPTAIAVEDVGQSRMALLSLLKRRR